jgi:hypothetical protein
MSMNSIPLIDGGKESCSGHFTPLKEPPVPTTTCSTVRLENLIVAQLVNKYPAISGTHWFITMFTTAPPLVPIINRMYVCIQFKFSQPISLGSVSVLSSQLHK